MARVVALLPDLLFGSKVQGMLLAAGHEVTVVGAAADIAAEDFDLVIADLCEDAAARISALAGGGTKRLAFYLHTDVDTRAAAFAAGFDVVVPRSRMAREGAVLVDGVLAGVQA
ncbi:MAG: hypothetical protein ACRDMZ_15570 [Solirubrobacteraceae bacterium]